MINLPRLRNFCSQLRIDSKEKGLVPLDLYGSQTYFLNKVVEGIENGTHFFVILKARQLGLSTICLALDLFWLFTHPGMQGGLTCDTDGNRDNFKSILQGYLDALPRGLNIPITAHNRNLLSFRNRSRLIYQVAGTRAKTGHTSTLGQAKGLNHMHGTEVSSWGDAEGTDSLIASLAENYPHRLYMFESTAKGMNYFHDMYYDAKESASRCAIFIGWWTKEDYRIDPNNGRHKTLWEVYGQDPPTGEELSWIQQVKFFYGHDIDKYQLAWWRWKLSEDIKDENLMFQFYPPTEEHAFILSGYRFFDLQKLKEEAQAVNAGERGMEEKYYRYRFGATFDETKLYEVSPKLCQMVVWEEPDPTGYYVISADPAFGSSYEADRFCVQVLRCYTDRIEQVAEYCTVEGTTYAFAWVIAHLAGAYRNSVMVLEINGPGMAVWQEIQRLQSQPTYVSRGNSTPGLFDVLGSIRNYLYSRPDSLSGGFNYHWKTTGDTKEWAMNQMRDVFERGILIIHSLDLIEEMRFITNDSGSIGSATNSRKDDRVIACALGIEGWQKMVLPELFDVGLSYQKSRVIRQNPDQKTVLGWTLQHYLQQFRKEEEIQ